MKPVNLFIDAAQPSFGVFRTDSYVSWAHVSTIHVVVPQLQKRPRHATLSEQK